VRGSILFVSVSLLVASSGCHRKPRPAGPPGDCAVVAEALATFDVGNYAAPGELTAAAAKYRDACDDAAINVDEQHCVAAARDAWTAKACVARMFPELTAAHDDGACQQIVDRLRASMLPSLDPALAKWATREFEIEETACREDAIKACMLGSGPGGCHAELPPPLRRQLQARINAAFKETAR
jgi:hypothetical protein